MSPFKSSLGRNVGKLVKTFATNNIGDGLARVASAKATGGTKVTSGNHTIHIFTEPGTFTALRSLTATNVLVVGGGGAGAEPAATYAGGGGGAGGLINTTDFDFAAGDFPVTVGCLLYTSPSPRDRQKSRMPSSA